MFTKKAIKASYRYFGEDGEFFKHGEVYYLTIAKRRILWRKYLEVTCRYGYEDQLYPSLPVIIYADLNAFDDDWSKA